MQTHPSGISKDTVDHVANLSRIELAPDELSKLSSELKGILDFIDKLKTLPVTGISPTSHILPVNNVTRDDKPKGCLPLDKVLLNAPLKEGNFFVVPKVIE